ncbi:MAG: P1 family peptidase [Alphaproteobacteria bacterium]|jgi:D-aminopeptidase|nr:P1 family peptidase [Alphaproteobacteria bacterium]
MDTTLVLADGRPRGRGLGLPFAANCGADNAITDVPGVEVGFTTLIEGEGDLVVGEGPVRTGVTAILPRGHTAELPPVWAAMFSLNGNGEMTGTHWINEAGYFVGPICITNTHGIGAVHEASTRWMLKQYGTAFGEYAWAMPVVAETCDIHLNDMNGFHVREEHVMAALDGATGGPLQEGNVGGGTGMICYEFKGGTGTASRVIEVAGGTYTVGALVQANHGMREWLNICGAPVGRHMSENLLWPREHGSIIAVIGTDMPLLPIQMQRLARRISIGVGRAGTLSGNNSGDIFLAFSTANARPEGEGGAAGTLRRHDYVPHELLDPVFSAVVESVDEAVINAMVAAEDMTGRDGNFVAAIDHGELMQVMARYGRQVHKATHHPE